MIWTIEILMLRAGKFPRYAMNKLTNQPSKQLINQLTSQPIRPKTRAIFSKNVRFKSIIPNGNPEILWTEYGNSPFIFYDKL